MTDRQYEIFERFAIVSVEENDVEALKVIRNEYGMNAANWVLKYMREKKQ